MTELADTPSDLLRSLHDQLVNSQLKPLKVDRWEQVGVKVVITYRPLEIEEYRNSFRTINDPNLKEKDLDEASMNANSDLLIKACKSIRFSGPIEKTFETFDNNLGAMLGMPEELISARAVCRKVFPFDGDLIKHVDTLVAWSNMAGAKAEEDFSGE